MSQTKTGVATFVKQLNGNGDGRVYRVDPPIAGNRWAVTEGEQASYDYVWVSAAVAYFGPETYIFGCDADGEVLDWCELEGSFQGSLDHDEALSRAGYEVTS